MTAPVQPDQSAQILLKLGEISATLAAMQEQLKTLPDHEARIRSAEQKIPDHLIERLASLEKWRYGLPLTGLIAASSAALAIYTALAHG